MRRAMAALGLAGLLAGSAMAAPTRPATSLERTRTHALRYHLALPEGWTPERTWPVVVVVPDASRDFEGNLSAFVAERGARPFILVAPEVMTCGGARSRLRELYACTDSEWVAIDPAHDFVFDDAGIGAALEDVSHRWHGERQAFLTGWEHGRPQPSPRLSRFRCFAVAHPRASVRPRSSMWTSRAPRPWPRRWPAGSSHACR